MRKSAHVVVAVCAALTAACDGGTLEYEVEHPRWRVHPVAESLVEGDLASLYGRDFAGVLAAPPVSAFVATGSPIAVGRGRRLSS